MQLTDEQLEQAARELCKMWKKDPDSNFNVVLANEHIKNWLWIQEAVDRVVGK